MFNLEMDWADALKSEVEKTYYKQLIKTMEKEFNEYEVFPSKEDVFGAFNHTPLSKVKVLLIGQDPYHDVNQAHGLSFSVRPGVKVPPSLQNIYKELYSDLGCPVPTHGYLRKWSEQGVLLLNTVLTVRAHQANSHQGLGWEEFTDAVIRLVNQQDRPIVIFLWGKPAQRKRTLLDNPLHLVIEAPHPSPLSSYRGFFGSRPFSRANDFLTQKGELPIDWCIETSV
jgi:uracil-DNA glycosylase